MEIKKPNTIVGTDGEVVDLADEKTLVEQSASAETSDHTGVEPDENSTSN